MIAVRDFLLPDIVLPPIVSILNYVQLDKSSLKRIYDSTKRQRKSALTREQTMKG